MRDGLMRLLHLVCVAILLCSGCSTWTISPDRQLPRLNEMSIPTEQTLRNFSSPVYRDERPERNVLTDNSTFRFSDLPEVSSVKFVMNSGSEVGSGVESIPQSLTPIPESQRQDSHPFVVVESQPLNFIESPPMQGNKMLAPTENPRPIDKLDNVSSESLAPVNPQISSSGLATDSRPAESPQVAQVSAEVVSDGQKILETSPPADAMLIDHQSTATTTDNPHLDVNSQSASGMLGAWSIPNVLNVCEMCLSSQPPTKASQSNAIANTCQNGGVMDCMESGCSNCQNSQSHSMNVEAAKQSPRDTESVTTSQSNAASSAAEGAKSLEPLKVCQGQFCTEIRGYGQYERLSACVSSPGQPMLIYCELENFESLARTDELGTQFETRLQATLTIYDVDGQVQQEIKFPENADIARNRRRDFYLHIPFIVGQLPRGRYEATVTIEDRLNKQSASLADRLPFEVR